MKKNLMSVIIMALVMANLILTAVLAFTIIPQTKKSNELIDQVCSAIDIELEGGQNKNTLATPIEDVEVYNITDSFTVNLASSDDGKKHIAVFSVGLSMNTKSAGYETYGGAEGLTAKETIIRSEINSIVSAYTIDEFNEGGQQKVKEEILKAMQSMFGGNDFIVAVNFSSVTSE